MLVFQFFALSPVSSAAHRVGKLKEKLASASCMQSARSRTPSCLQLFQMLRTGSLDANSFQLVSALCCAALSFPKLCFVTNYNEPKQKLYVSRPTIWSASSSRCDHHATYLGPQDGSKEFQRARNNRFILIAPATCELYGRGPSASTLSLQRFQVLFNFACNLQA